MDVTVFISGVIALIGFVVHTFIGDQDHRKIKPAEKSGKAWQFWLQARAGWHVVSFDLLAFGTGLVYLAFNELAAKDLLLQITGVYFLGYAVFWLLALVVSGVKPSFYLVLGQWMLLLLIGGLAYFSV